MGSVDVTGNIRVIENLKAGILNDVARLYGNMCSAGGESERLELLADLLIQTYTLSGRLGVSPAELDGKAARLLRVAALDDDEPLREDFQALIGHIGNFGKRGS